MSTCHSWGKGPLPPEQLTCVECWHGWQIRGELGAGKRVTEVDPRIYHPPCPLCSDSVATHGHGALCRCQYLTYWVRKALIPGMPEQSRGRLSGEFGVSDSAGEGPTAEEKLGWLAYRGNLSTERIPVVTRECVVCGGQIVKRICRKWHFEPWESLWKGLLDGVCQSCGLLYLKGWQKADAQMRWGVRGSYHNGRSFGGVAAAKGPRRGKGPPYSSTRGLASFFIPPRTRLAYWWEKEEKPIPLPPDIQVPLSCNCEIVGRSFPSQDVAPCVTCGKMHPYDREDARREFRWWVRAWFPREPAQATFAWPPTYWWVRGLKGSDPAITSYSDSTGPSSFTDAIYQGREWSRTEQETDKEGRPVHAEPRENPDALPLPKRPKKDARWVRGVLLQPYEGHLHTMDTGCYPGDGKDVPQKWQRLLFQFEGRVVTHAKPRFWEHKPVRKQTDRPDLDPIDWDANDLSPDDQ